MAVGRVEPFDINKGDWEAYKDRLEQYFVVNAVDPVKRVPHLITLIGADAYELLVTLCTPAKPSTLTFEQIDSLFAGHLQPKPSVLAERYKFRQRKQAKNESIADYLADLKRLSRYCDFGTWLDESIRDQFVCGLYSESIRLRLFTEVDLKLKSATNLAVAMEAAEINAAVVDHKIMGASAAGTTSCYAVSGVVAATGSAMQARARRGGSNGRGAPNRADNARAAPSGGSYTRTVPNGQRARSNGGGGAIGMRPADSCRTNVGHGHVEHCAVCGRAHAMETCKFRFYTCRVCNREGHLKKMCPRLANVVGHNYVQDSENKSADEDDLEVNFSFVKQSQCDTRYKPYTMKLSVNNRDILMEIDTGSTISCISSDCYDTYFRDCTLKPSNLRLRYYTGETVNALGKIRPAVTLGTLTKKLDLYVIDNGKTNLLGREWLEELGVQVLNQSVGTTHYVKSSTTFDLTQFSSRFKEVFAEGLGRYSGGLVTLRLKEGAPPIFLRARPLAYALREPVERELERLQREGVITPVETSEWATPIVPVVKADGTIRICGDYKISLNKHLEVDRFPLPRVEDLFARLHGGQKFSKIDLSQAYAQLVLDDTSKYTVINTHKGLFKYNRLIYGLSSSPSIFQRTLEQMLGDIPKVGVFLDDVVITGRDDQEHMKNLNLVFERLQKYGLKIKKEKCSFMAESITYLGYVVNSQGIHTCPKKIEGIQKSLTPSNVTELRSFIGMAMYYGKFVHNMSSIMTPLFALLKKGVKFVWTVECDEAFVKVKQLLSSSKVLVHYSPELPLILTTDASSYGLGAVISHRLPDGSERAIAYASRVLNKAEKAYSQIDKEALGIIYAVKKFHQYLYGRRFTLRTDHKPLVTIFGDKTGIPVMAASRMQRWAVILGGYQYDIEYIPTSRNAADALSRLPVQGTENSNRTEVTYINFVQNFLPITSLDIKRATEKDETLRKVCQFIDNGWPHIGLEDDLKPYFTRKQELYVEGGCIMWGYRMVIPASLKHSILRELHSSHQGIVKMKTVARSFVWWPNIDKEIEQMGKQCTICAAEAEAPAKAAPQPWPYHQQVWSRLHMDFLGPYEGRTFFVIIDATSKWIEASVMPRTTAAAVIKVLMETFARFGLPKEVVSDNGPPFSSQEVERFMTQNGIVHIFTAPYHPASNGAAEGAVKLCKRALKKAAKEKVDLEMALQTFLLNYRNCVHSTTGETPARMLQKRSLRCRLDLMKPAATIEQRVQRVQRKQIERGTDKQAAQLDQGAPVWVHEYNAGDKWVSGRVSEVKGNRNYVVTKENGTTGHRHIDQLRKRLIHNAPYTVSQDTMTVAQDTMTVTEPSQPVEPPPPLVPPRVASSSDAAIAPSTSTTTLPLDPPDTSKRVRKPPVRYGFEFD